MANNDVWIDQSKFKVGMPLSATELNRIIDALANRITGDGKTILVRAFPGGQITISAIDLGSRSSVNTEASPLWMKTADTKAELEEPVSEIYFGRVTTDDNGELGMVCVRKPNNDGWNSFTHFE